MAKTKTTFRDGERPELMRLDTETVQCPFCHKRGGDPELVAHLQGHQRSIIKYGGYNIYKCHLGCMASSHYHCSTCPLVVVKIDSLLSHLKTCCTTTETAKTTTATPVTVKRTAQPQPLGKTRPLQNKPTAKHAHCPYAKLQNTPKERMTKKIHEEGEGNDKDNIHKLANVKVKKSTTFCDGERPELMRLDTETVQCPFCHKTGGYPELVAHLQGHERSALKYGGYNVYKCHLGCVSLSHYHCSSCPRVIVKKVSFLNHFKTCCAPTASTMDPATTTTALVPSTTTAAPATTAPGTAATTAALETTTTLPPAATRSTPPATAATITVPATATTTAALETTTTPLPETTTAARVTVTTTVQSQQLGKTGPLQNKPTAKHAHCPYAKLQITPKELMKKKIHEEGEGNDKDNIHKLANVKTNTTFCEGERPELVRLDTETVQCPFCHKTGGYPELVAHLQGHERSALKHGGYNVYKCHLGCVVLSHYHCSSCPRVIVKKVSFLNHFKTCCAPTVTTTAPATTTTSLVSATTTEALAPTAPGTAATTADLETATTPPPATTTAALATATLTVQPQPLGKTRPLQNKPITKHTHRPYAKLQYTPKELMKKKTHGEGEGNDKNNIHKLANMKMKTTFRDGERPELVRLDTETVQCPFCHKTGGYPELVAHLQGHERSALKHGGYNVYKCHLGCVELSHYHCSSCPRVIVKKVSFLNHFKTCCTMTATTTAPATAAPATASTTTAPPPAATRTSTCCLCGIRLLKKNLKVHIQRHHTTRIADITAKCHLRSMCIDKKRGIFAVARFFRGPGHFIHAQKCTWGSDHRVSCQLVSCNRAYDSAQRSGLLGFDCVHVRSLVFCPATTASPIDLDEDVLTEMVKSEWFSKKTEQECLKRKLTAETQGSPLTVEVNLGDEQGRIYFSVSEPRVFSYSRLGRVMVHYDRARNEWRCRCLKARKPCPHASIAKWHLHQSRPGFFQNIEHCPDKSFETHVDDAAQPDDALLFPPEGKALVEMMDYDVYGLQTVIDYK